MGNGNKVAREICKDKGHDEGNTASGPVTFHSAGQL
jgi:hypothetical protein